MIARPSSSVFAAAALLALSLLPAGLMAQASLVVLADQGTAVNNVPDNGTLNMVAPAIGRTDTAVLSVSYRGDGSLSITLVDRTGSNDFSFQGNALPINLGVNETTSLGNLRYTATSGIRALGRITFYYSEAQKSGSIRTGSFTFAVNGFSPEFAYGYAIGTGNTNPIAAGGAIVFPPTPLNPTTPAVATITLSNRGSASGVVDRIAASGSAVFQLGGLPLLPVQIDPGKDLRFTVSFAPTQREQQTGALTIESGGRTIAFAIQGSGASAVYEYTVIRDAGETRLLPEQTVTLADAQVGEKSTLLLRVKNSGNIDGTINSITVLGSAYQLGELPFLPLKLVPGNSVTFSLTFAPTLPGRASGRLRIGDDTFELTASGLGANLTYAYVIGDTTTPVLAGGAVLFSPIQVGRESAARFQVANTGTQAASVSSIFVTGSTTFKLSGLPDLPLNLDAGKSVSFLITLAPTAVGVAEGVLRVGAQGFALVGSATAPTPLSAIAMEGPRGVQAPLQQPSYTLSLADVYPLDLEGTLTLTFNSEVFTNDATVQFASGGRTVRFTIAAGTRRAVFSNNEQQVRLQTGSVAGTITLTPSVVTRTGVDLTPADPPTLKLTISQSAPQIVSVQSGGKTANSFTLLLTGYATGRSITQVELTVNGVTGETINNPKLTLNVESAFLSWYQNAQSQQFGSLFTATIPVLIEGKTKAGTALADAIQSVSVTMGNAQGTSAAKVVDLK
ncbi:MAG: choice-of-anchor D domain-containing protein [Acidobacteria bacterium]|nr:choice-of-anchor D domain-containing protein [Acidobacteriota bacterium]